MANSALRGRSFRDFVLEVDVRLTRRPETSASVGLGFRSERVGYGYRLLVDIAMGNYLVLRDEGATSNSLTGGWKPSYFIKQTENHLMVVASGSQLKVYANGGLLGEFHDDAFSKGSMALLVEAWRSPVEARFSNFQVYEPSAADNQPPPLLQRIRG